MVTHHVRPPFSADEDTIGDDDAANVTEEWVWSSIRFGEVAPTACFGAGPGLFRGAVVCTSRIKRDDRHRLWALVVSHGGTFSASLSPTCTHLLVPAGQAGGQPKCDKAWAAGIQVLQPHWSVAGRAARLLCEAPPRGRAALAPGG